MSVGETMQIDPELYACLPGPLVDWFRRNARDLPWRRDRTPYCVWLSEIMLQQTRIETVRGYFERFRTALPDIPSLAAADEEQVLKLWEGLGYYSRARNLRAAAKVIMEKHQGEFPRTFEEVRELPGIGDYTAGAICSIAFGLPEPAVDGNVMRVMARLAAFEGDVRSAAVRQEVAEGLRSVYPPGAESDFTQALMELGEVICTPSGTPDCGRCPLVRFCRARAQGKENSLPVPPEKKSRPVEKRTVLILRCGGKVALRKRPDRGLLANLWEFPSLDGWKTAREVSALLDGIRVRKGPSAVHVFSHLAWDMISCMAELPGETEEYVWFEPDRLPAVPSAFRVFRNALASKLPQKSGESI